MSVQLQWDLEHTANATLSGVRALVHAASTDNIQVKAILACEGFGATIAMCQETCRKIERTVVPAPPPVPLAFIACAIGYSAGDCVSQLSSSHAGLRFLGLAATLVTTLPIHEAGNLVASMLVNSAADNALVPSRRQTIDLLKSIEGRCYRAAFGEEVFGWELLVGKQIQQKLVNTYGPSGAGSPALRSRPGIDGIETLVDALRQLHRVGESNISRVSIRTAQAVPWTIAFVKWCLGAPPSVVLEDGECILSQDGSQVEVIVSQEDPSLFEVKLYRSMTSLSTLIKSKVDHKMAGMIGIVSYGKLLLHDNSFGDKLPMKVIGELIPFGIYLIMQNLVVLKDTMDFDNAPTRRNAHEFDISDIDIHNQRLFPFPDETAILETCGQILNYKFSTQLRPLQDRRTIFELPLLSHYLEKICSRCSCAECSGIISSKRGCSKDRLIGGIADIFGIIFTLSLFDHRDNLLVTTSTNNYKVHSNSFGQAIRNILIYNSPFSCHVSDILRWAHWLVRHDEIVKKQWVMSCSKDQAVWPMLYETTSFSKHGYLRLLWLPGKLYFDNDTYELVVSKIYNFASTSRSPDYAMAENVSRACNLFPGARSRWQITSQDKILEAFILIDGPSREYTAPWMFSSPHEIIPNLAEALLADDCRHGRDAELATPDPFCVFFNPFNSNFANINSRVSTHSREYTQSGESEHSGESECSDDERSKSEIVWAIAVDSSEDLRFAALGRIRKDIPIVLRGNSCLGCCLATCRQAGCQLLVL
jgi:hypothetical protein